MNDFAAKLSSQTAKMRNQVPDHIRQKQILEELAHYKRKLQEVLLQKDEVQALTIQDKLIKIHGELVALNVARIEKRYGFVSPTVLQKMIEEYTQDCYALAMQVDSQLYE